MLDKSLTKRYNKSGKKSKGAGNRKGSRALFHPHKPLSSDRLTYNSRGTQFHRCVPLFFSAALYSRRFREASSTPRQRLIWRLCSCSLFERGDGGYLPIKRPIRGLLTRQCADCPIRIKRRTSRKAFSRGEGGAAPALYVICYALACHKTNF